MMIHLTFAFLVAQRPLMKDFMGVNGHTVLFKPELYRQVCQLVRDYHPLGWDLDKETNYAPRFPMSRNQVNWEQVYGSWKGQGFTTDVSVMMDEIPTKVWKDVPRDAFAYGFSFARFFGPSGTQRLVESVEVGNEPTNHTDLEYRAIFENMAKGIRQGDPSLKIATCAVRPGAGNKYEKSIEGLKGLESLFDIISVHDYAMAEPWPTWRRSYPEDPKIPYLQQLRETIDWRNKNAPGKQIWLTEFGWDSSTKKPSPTGDWAKWVGNSDLEQAQFLVRSFLVTSAMDIDRAYIYFFNDDDAPQLHGSSGLTRKFVPKPSFYAVGHLFRTLGDYRFDHAVAKEDGRAYVFEYRSGKDAADRVWVLWSPTGKGQATEFSVSAPSGQLVKAEQMPLGAEPASKVSWKMNGGNVVIPISESPTYLWWRAK